MGKIIASGDSPLDRKVKALLARGVDWTDVTGYTLERSAGQPAMLTVKIIADVENIEPLKDWEE
jgi:hypothetical protein